MRLPTRSLKWLYCLLILPSPALAQDGSQASGPSPHVVWHPVADAPGCPSPQTVRSAVLERLGRPVAAGDEAPPSGRPRESWQIEAFVLRRPPGFRAAVVARTGDGRLVGMRDLYAEDCATLAEASVLAIVLALGAATDRPATTATSELAEPEPAPAPTSGPAPPAPEQLTSRARGDVQATLKLARGLLPATALGFGLDAALQLRPRWQMRAGVSLWPEHSTRSQGERFAFGLAAVQASVCASPWRWSLAVLQACAGASGGLLHSVVFERDPTEPGQRPWAAADAALRAEIGRGGWITSLQLGLQVPLIRHRFRAAGGEREVFQQPSVALTAAIGAGVRFW